MYSMIRVKVEWLRILEILNEKINCHKITVHVWSFLFVVAIWHNVSCYDLWEKGQAIQRKKTFHWFSWTGSMNETESAVFKFCRFSLFLKDLFFQDYLEVASAFVVLHAHGSTVWTVRRYSVCIFSHNIGFWHCLCWGLSRWREICCSFHRLNKSKSVHGLFISERSIFVPDYLDLSDMTLRDDVDMLYCWNLHI